MNTATLPARKRRSVLDLAAARLCAFNDAAKVELPENLDELSLTELSELAASAKAALEVLAGLEEPSEDDVKEGQRLVEVMQDVLAASDSRGEAASTNKSQLSDLLAGAPEAPVAGTEQTDEEKAAAEKEAADAAALVASGTPSAADVAKRTKQPKVTEDKPQLALVASADIPGIKMGHVFGDVEEMAAVLLERTNSYPSGGEAGASLRHGVGRISRQFETGLVASAMEADEQLLFAVNQDRLKGPDETFGLIAAGGWCSPSESLYDLVETEAADGLLDIPEIQIKRGGVRFTRGPEFSAIYSAIGFAQTEAQAIAGQAKTFYKVPCANFEEVRAGVIGIGITAGILQNTAYPELTARVIRGALIAHAHKVNASTLATIAAGSTAYSINFGTGTFAKLLSAIELAAIDIRYRYAMAEATVMEVVLPIWVKGVLRQDLSFRSTATANDNLNDQNVLRHFADRHVRVQFVFDWQGAGFGQSTPATAYPTSVKFLIYPAGTWVRGLGNVIKLDTIYDSAGLVQNEFTALFVEESLLVAKFGFESRIVDVPIVGNGDLARLIQMQ